MGLGALKFYDNIALVQSYPNLVDACSYLLRRKSGRSLLLINGDPSIERFAKKLFGGTNVDVIRYGSAIFLRHKPFSLFRVAYVFYLLLRTPNFECRTLLLTFGNWCDTGAIFIEKIQRQKTVNMIAYEEVRYRIAPNQRRLPLYCSIINRFVKTKIEAKDYFYREGLVEHEFPISGLGIEKTILFDEEIHAEREKDYSLIPPIAENDRAPYALYIEKNIIKSRSGNLRHLILLSHSIRRFALKNDLRIFVKYKPRDRHGLRSLYYRALGFRILDASVPAQLYAASQRCLCVVGFASSSMAENYGKNVYCVSSIERLFYPSVAANVTSLRQRGRDNDHLHFIETLEELENLTVSTDTAKQVDHDSS